MQLLSVDSPVQNKASNTMTPQARRPSSHVALCDSDTYKSMSPRSLWVSPPTLASLEGARGRPHVGLPNVKSPELCIEQAKHQFAAGHVRQGVEWVMRTIDIDGGAVDACLEVMWDHPVLSRLPNVLRHVLTRFDSTSPEFKNYQWLLMLTFQATGNRQMGLRALGQAINSQDETARPPVGALQTPSTEHWLRRHGMAPMSQAEFWTGVGAEATVGEGITQARCHLLEALNLANEHLEDTLPLLAPLLGPQRHVLASLGAPQTLRLLELHARGQAGVDLSEDEVRAMASTLTEQQRLDHLGRAIASGHPFHVSTLLASGVVLADVPANLVGSATCASPYLVEQLSDSGMSVERLADLLVKGPAGDGPVGNPLPIQTLEVLLQRHLSADYRIGGKADGPTLLWEALQRKDAAAVTLLRRYGANCNATMQVTHADGSTGITTPGIYALAQGDAPTMRAMGIPDAAALLPGIEIILAAVKPIS